MRSKKGWIIAGCIGGVLLVAYFSIAVHFMNRFAWRTSINNVDCSNLTIRDAETNVEKKAETYVLSLEQRGGRAEQISGKSIDLVSHMDGKLVDCQAKQNSFLWPIYLITGNKTDVESGTKYDEKKLSQQISTLNCFKKENIVEPQNAKLSEYKEDLQGFDIVKELEGTKLNKKILLTKVNSSVQVLAPKLSLDENGCYVEPKIRSNSDIISKARVKANQFAKAKVTYTFGEDSEVVDGNVIGKWIAIDKNNKVTLSKEKVRKYVDSLASKYNTFGVKRPFQTAYGEEMVIHGGDYGWWMNCSKETDALIQLVTSGKTIEKEPAYYQRAANFSRKDYGNTYVEVNITRQHMFLYVKGEKILDSDIVSGNENKGNGTPVGVFPILYTQRNAVLKGADYRSNVSYWMPFVGNVGLHDAIWRHGKFGKKIYLRSGSHGCVNLPPETAKRIFPYVKKGTPVIVYK